METWESYFNDWVKLLESANAVDLMKDPQSIWDEAWRQAVVQCMVVVERCRNENEPLVINKMQELLK